jgi:hypothetical protein
MHVPSRQTVGIIELYSTLNGSRVWEHSGFIPTKFCVMKDELHSINCKKMNKEIRNVTAFNKTDIYFSKKIATYFKNHSYWSVL